MALGAFLAGVMLAGSNYRHELEADIEPFRGMLLALFFMGVGMLTDMGVVTAKLGLIVAAAIVITLLKAGIVAVLFCATCPNRGDGVRAGSVLTAAGEIFLRANSARRPPFAAALSDRALPGGWRVRLPEPDDLERGPRLGPFEVGQAPRAQPP
jgi:hypothetical protein